MKKTFLIILLASGVWACSVAVKNKQSAPALAIPAGTYEDTLRFLYSLSPAQWPTPTIDPGVVWKEIGVVPDSPLKPYFDSLKQVIGLGKPFFSIPG